MTGSETFVRGTLARTAQPVVPRPDPLGRLLLRRQRRQRRRWASVGAGALAAVLAMVSANLMPAAPPKPRIEGAHVVSPWAWRLITGPARGGLGADAAFTEALRDAFDADAARQRQSVAPSLDEVAVLFAADLERSRVALVVYHGNGRAHLVVARAGRGAAPAALAAVPGAPASRPVTPYLEVTENLPEGPYMITLVPTGCNLDLTPAASRGIDLLELDWLDGTLVRPDRWPDHLVRPGGLHGEWAQVVCDRVTRYLAPAGPVIRQTARLVTTGARGAPDPQMVATAAQVWADHFTSVRMPVGNPRLLWGGAVPGEHRPVLVLAGRYDARRSAVVLIHGRGPAGSRAVGFAPATYHLPDEAAQLSRVERPAAEHHLTTTAPFVDADMGARLVAVRLPAEVGGRAVWSERLLILAPPGTETVYPDSASGAASYAPISVDADGMGVWTHPGQLQGISLTAFDAAGQVLARTDLASERVDAGSQFGLPLWQDW